MSRRDATKTANRAAIPGRGQRARHRPLHRAGLRHVLGELEADLRAAVALELGRRLLERRPPDVEVATEFASALFVGGLERLGPALR